MIQFLIENGADVNHLDKVNNSVLILAIQSGNFEKFHQPFNLKARFYVCLGFERAAQLLIQKGANVNVKNHRGKTALIVAASQGKKK